MILKPEQTHSLLQDLASIALRESLRGRRRREFRSTIERIRKLYRYTKLGIQASSTFPLPVEMFNYLPQCSELENGLLILHSEVPIHSRKT